MKKYVLLLAVVAIPTLGIAQEKARETGDNFRKAIAAAGGEGRLNTLKAPTMWMETGTYHGMGDGIPFVVQYASYWPKRWYRQLVEEQFAIGVAGEQVTLFQGGGSDGQKLSGDMAADALHRIRVAWAPLLYPLLEEDYTLTDVPGVEVEGKPTVGVKAAHESGTEIMLYFDKTTFLLAKTVTNVAAPEMNDARVKSEALFSDHKSFGGATLPSSYKIFYDGKLMVEGEIVAIKTHATIDPGWFGTTGPARVR